eukprot:193915-Karenia_brevis.AAC.1
MATCTLNSNRLHAILREKLEACSIHAEGYAEPLARFQGFCIKAPAVFRSSFSIAGFITSKGAGRRSRTSSLSATLAGKNSNGA